jgi:bacitracin transport system ATP-binding protein
MEKEGEAAIATLRGVSKRFGRRLAVDGLSLALRRGEIYGFLGRNGAGKTTTIRILLGLTRPSVGDASLFGEDPGRGRGDCLGRVGSIVGVPGFYSNLTGRENLEVQRRLMGVSDPTAIGMAFGAVGLEDTRKLVRDYSTGMRQKLAIARALLNEPELLVLDEPVNGLDPQGIREARNLFSRLAKERGTAILVSSHILSEVERIADRIGIIHEGKLVRELGMREIADMNRHYLEFSVSDVPKACLVAETKFGLAEYLVPEPGILRLYAGLDEGPKLNREFVAAGVEVKEMKVMKDTLEDFFLEITGGRA